MVRGDPLNPLQQKNWEAPFDRFASEPEPDAALNLVGIDDCPSTGAKAIAKAELHQAGDLSREAYHDLIGKPRILVRFCVRQGSGGNIDDGNVDVSEFVPNGEGGGEGPIVEEGSNTESGIGTHSPFGIAIVGIAH